MRYLITGAAGFIGSTLADALLADGHEVVGIDAFTSNYDRALKEHNVKAARAHDSFTLLEQNLATDEVPAESLDVDGVFHLAAQPGVRASWGREFSLYTDLNILATQRLLEMLVRTSRAPRVVYSSSSSIYGNALSLPTLEDALPAPVSPYGVTKLAGEHLCGTYHHNFGLEAVSLRFFTVYGPRQRPDMAFHRFIRSMLRDEPIAVFGDGSHSRDFTYVDDIVAACRAAMQSGPAIGVYNLGGGSTVTVRETLELLERITGRTARVEYGEPQEGDVLHTSADTSRARHDFAFSPATSLQTGLTREVAWLDELLSREGTAASV